MSFNGSGTFNVNSSGQPAVTNTTITIAAFNALTADLATGLSTAVCKDGQTTTTARIPFAAGINSTLTTDSSSVGTGSILTAGGIGIAKALFVGGLANIAGALTAAAATDATSTSTGSIITSGGIGVAKALWVGGLANIAGGVTMQSTLAVTGHVTLEGVTSTGATGTGLLVFGTTPTLTTPAIGAATGASLVLSGNASAAAGTFSGALQSTTYLSTSGIIRFVAATSSVPMFKSVGTQIHTRLADDSADADFFAGDILASGRYFFNGATAADLRLERSSTTLLVRKGDGSGDGGITCGALTCTGAVNLGGASGTFTNSVVAINGVVVGGT